MINYTALELPMGGAKASGLGSRHGAGGHPQVLRPAGDRGHAAARAQARSPHVPVQGGAPRGCSRWAVQAACTAAASATEAIARAPAARAASATQDDALAGDLRAARPRAAVRARGSSSRRSCGARSPSRARCAGVRLNGRSSTYTHAAGRHRRRVPRPARTSAREGLRMPSSAEITTPSNSSPNSSRG